MEVGTIDFHSSIGGESRKRTACGTDFGALQKGQTISESDAV